MRKTGKHMPVRVLRARSDQSEMRVVIGLTLLMFTITAQLLAS